MAVFHTVDRAEIIIQTITLPFVTLWSGVLRPARLDSVQVRVLTAETYRSDVQICTSQVNRFRWQSLLRPLKPVELLAVRVHRLVLTLICILELFMVPLLELYCMI